MRAAAVIACAAAAAANPHAKCAESCGDNTDCQPNAPFCGECVPYNQTGKLQCGSTCGGHCNNDDDCPFKKSCGYCWHQGDNTSAQKVCRDGHPDAKCGTWCNTNDDCDAAPSTPDCRQCQNRGDGSYICGIGCGRLCHDDTECDAKGWCSACGSEIPDVCGHGNHTKWLAARARLGLSTTGQFEGQPAGFKA